MDTPSDSQRKAWARLSTFTSFVSRICFFKARRSDSDSVNGCIVIPPAIDFTRVRSGGVKKILSTYLGNLSHEVIMIAMPGVLLGGIPRGAGFQGTVVRERSPGDHQPFLGSRAFALQTRRHAPCGHLDRHRTFLPVSSRHVGPRLGGEGLAPRRH